MHNVFDEFNLLCWESAKVDEMKIENDFESLNMDDDLSQRQGEVEEDVKPNGNNNSI